MRSSRYPLYGSSLVGRGARGPYRGTSSLLRYLRTVFRETPSSRWISLIDFPCRANTLISTTVSKLCMASSQMHASIPIQGGQFCSDEGGHFYSGVNNASGRLQHHWPLRIPIPRRTDPVR